MDVVSDGDVEVDVTMEDLRWRGPAVADQLTQLRHALADWAAHVGVAAGTIADLVLATYEAMANAVEHAYRDRASNGVRGMLDLRVHADRVLGIVTVTVTDHGRWRPPPADPATRGRGLAMIHSHGRTRRDQPPP